MPDLSVLIQHYGYIAILVGCLFEGETVTILGGISAHQGWLSLPGVIFFAGLGGALGDLTLFLLGRRYGERLLARLKRDPARIEALRDRVRRHQDLAVFGVRFLYGLRLVGPLVIGASGVGLWRFVLFNLLGAATWATLFVVGGYLFGTVLARVLGDLEHHLLWLLPLAAALALFIGWMRRRRI
ncbi:DedA family protein [Halotalea alkalilenta]|uniref:VTT domain-containing protein n=1 Tax=Halotalea alkalilenta TaxID=376489 RepID=A0A172YES3_9GAMM|nr:DedA family protein [Halotalea alkalilenta]ANF57465.1 hypothetical protein A5892_08300 [Halotalea alkalilenta]